jgi:hypothetical protein
VCAVWLCLCRRFKKLYEDYKPSFMHWKLLLLCRKFALAVIAIMLDFNPLFQVRRCFVAAVALFPPHACACPVSRHTRHVRHTRQTSTRRTSHVNRVSRLMSS